MEIMENTFIFSSPIPFTPRERKTFYLNMEN
jgi:hypothetical protein